MSSVANELATARRKLGEAELANIALKEKRQQQDQQIDALEAATRTLREEAGAAHICVARRRLELAHSRCVSRTRRECATRGDGARGGE